MGKFGAQNSFVGITRVNQFAKESGLEMEIISNIPVFTIDADWKNEDISKVVEFFGKNTVFRIINSQFVDYAIEFGTDKYYVDEHDFRGVAYGSGFDVWWVEEQFIKQGLRKSDVFCGIPYEVFVKECNKFSSSELGIPNDRAAILIYNIEKVQEIEWLEEGRVFSDGYAFKDVNMKKEALLGIIKFNEAIVVFEAELHALWSVDDKITLLEKEIFMLGDLKMAPYLALNIIRLLHNESLINAKNASEISIVRINKLKAIADRLEYEIRMIGIVNNLASQVISTREAFVIRDERKMSIMQTRPDFIIETTQRYLLEMQLDQKYIDALNQVIEDAEKCNAELWIGTNRTIRILQKKTRADIDNIF